MLTNGILITEWRAAHALLGGWALWLGWWL